ncbi:MAG: NAD(P)/FAD-dependent oxidoreductase [Actinomycetota bacterium]|nr:NAD(P)/FAD-dependent oxidoreductase [Actinomycetota bacterium]MDQ3648439.1 NAD(P)/FAD-dependent oxidoreductase [Actinomycetota bacterium]
MAFDVVIAGGGFGGLYAARRLERELARHSARITMVTETNYLLYTPLLPGAASGSLEPRHVVVPVREELGWTDVRLASLTGGDHAAREVRVRTVDGRDDILGYDHLILALGSVSRMLPVPGLAEHGLGFKGLADAVALRNRALWNLEVAESLPDPAHRGAYLTFVFVGAGYAGVEAIAELQYFVNDVIDRYPRCRIDGTRWIMVEAEDRIMQEIPESLASFAQRELRGRGIELRLRTRLDSLSKETARLSSGEEIPTRTLCWTTGVKPRGVVAELGLPLDQGGRVITDRTMLVRGCEGVWAIGDAAAVPDPAHRARRPCPPTAQHALRQGRRVADNVAATLRGRRVRPFRYRTLGVFVDLGRHQAVATMLGVRLRGLPAWFAARTYHLLLMPGVARRWRLAADWTVGLLFGRASAELGQLGHPPRLGGEGDAGSRGSGA